MKDLNTDEIENLIGGLIFNDDLEDLVRIRAEVHAQIERTPSRSFVSGAGGFTSQRQALIRLRNELDRRIQNLNSLAETRDHNASLGVGRRPS